MKFTTDLILWSRRLSGGLESWGGRCWGLATLAFQQCPRVNAACNDRISKPLQSPVVLTPCRRLKSAEVANHKNEMARSAQCYLGKGHKYYSFGGGIQLQVYLKTYWVSWLQMMIRLWLCQKKKKRHISGSSVHSKSADCLGGSSLMS